MTAAIVAMREAFGQLASGQVKLPTRQQLHATGERGVALVMPCYSPVSNMFSLKNATVFPRNSELGLPVVQSTLLLTDGATGSPLAVMEAGSLTAIRTGAASGLATDLLARSDAEVVAIIGAGVQARTQLEAVACVRPIRLARVFTRRAESADQFAKEMSRQLGLPVERATSAAEAVRDADIVCTATGSTTPVFDDRDVRVGTHINAVGAFRPDMFEVPAATVCRSTIVVDHRASAMEEAGDLLIPLGLGLIQEEHFGNELGRIVLGDLTVRRSPEEITLFKSVGIAIQDLCAAVLALENARRLGLGKSLDATRSD